MVVVGVESGVVVTRVGNEGKLGPVAWSPDGKHLALISGVDRHDPAAGRLLVKPVTGGALQNVLPDYEGHVRAVAWKDADTVAYIGDEGVWSKVGEVGRDGSAATTLVPSGRPIFTELTVSRDGTAFAMRGNSPGLRCVTRGPGLQ